MSAQSVNETLAAWQGERSYPYRYAEKERERWRERNSHTHSQNTGYNAHTPCKWSLPTILIGNISKCQTNELANIIFPFLYVCDKKNREREEESKLE